MNRTLNQMLSFVESRRVAEREAILNQARAEAERLIAEAHRKARLRVKEMVAQERRLRTQALHGAQVRAETERRNHEMRLTQRALEQERRLLEEALLARWRDEASRRQWLESCVGQALRLLPVGVWEIVRPVGFSSEDLTFLMAHLGAAGVVEVIERSEADLEVGIRIGCRGAWIDGSLAGLLAKGQGIEAHLLALMCPA
ncbi:MAG: hypothetical protein HQL86_05615 [Magnetococcales bacterium]|nr:hypothetical protein [Magnetococcales bacterium]